MLNWDYGRTARQYGLVAEPGKLRDLDTFPIEKARLRSALYLVLLNTVATAAYGWVIKFRVVSNVCRSNSLSPG